MARRLGSCGTRRVSPVRSREAVGISASHAPRSTAGRSGLRSSGRPVWLTGRARLTDRHAQPLPR